MNNNYINELFSCLESTIVTKKLVAHNVEYTEGISLLIDEFTLHKRNGSNIFFVGNGGSAAIASHMTVDFMKNGCMKTIGLQDSSVMTCIGNDYGYEYIYSRQLMSLMRKGDLLIAISSSGNSSNIINAINIAKKCDGSVITLTGFQPDNKARQLGDINVYVPCESYGIVESIHNIILQQVVDAILNRDGVN